MPVMQQGLRSRAPRPLPPRADEAADADSQAPDDEPCAQSDAAGTTGEEETTVEPEEESELQELRKDFTALQTGVRNRLRRKILDQETRSLTVRDFAIKSMGTIVGWFTAEVFFAFLKECVFGLTPTERGDALLARSIYAWGATVAVPVCFWALADIDASKASAWTSDQVRLIKGCLPLLVAWAWRDFLLAFLAFADRDFWPQLSAAITLTLFQAVCTHLDCFAAAMSKFKAGSLESLLGHFKVVPKYFGLAVGFAWNMVAKWPSEQLKKEFHAPLFVFMIQVVYLVIITTLVSLATARWSRRYNKDEKQLGRRAQGVIGALASVKDKEDVEPSEEELNRQLFEELRSEVVDFTDTTTNVMMDGLHFVYAWAVLDTVNALYFTFLLGCSGPKTCSYQSNFAFASLLTFLFTSMAMMMKVTDRRTTWDEAATNLMTNGMALSTGWAWANFCATALTEALSVHEVPTKWMWVLIFLFAWLCMSVLFYRFSVEERAWRRHVIMDLTGYGIFEPAPLPEPEQPAEEPEQGEGSDQAAQRSQFAQLAALDHYEP